MSSPMECPSCRVALLTLNMPCWNCNMQFLPNLECSLCHKFELAHMRTCPPRERHEKPRVLCPLCSGKRHRHEVGPARHECLWRQCFGASVPETSDNLKDFGTWLDSFIDGPPMAGSVDAERIIRQQAKVAKKG